MGDIGRVLMVAYHFPPLAGSSGIQRTLRFVQQLPAFGWQPLVLSANPRAYERVADDLMADIPSQTVVRRALALDTARHLALKGRYVGAWARPDRWRTWQFDGVRQGMQMIRRYKPDALWSTFPIATAHVIGAELQRRSGLPWVADFRDPMAQDGYPSDPRTWAAYRQIEQAALAQARWSVFTTAGAARTYRERYPQWAQRVVVLENGYDEDSFAEAERSDPAPQPLHPGAITLLHSGIVYPEERDPSALFEALQRLAAQGRIDPQRLRLRFRAAVHDQLLHDLAARYGVSDFIECVPPVPYRDALLEMRRADGLMVLQSAGCNEQVPAKLYEYLRAGRPVLCLSDPAGDTAGVLRQAGLPDIAPLSDAAAIAAALARFVDAVAQGRAALPGPAAVMRASRAERSRELAALLARARG
jgi:glycosyltransferase involved in cell wall biosynthesis